MPSSVSSYDSETSSIRSIHSGSPPSSVCSFGDEEHLEDLQRATKEMVQRLLKQKNEHDTLVSAWKIRCETLEGEVERLAALVVSLEKSKAIPATPTSPKVPESTLVAPTSPRVAVPEPWRSSVSKGICLDWRAATTNEVIPVVDPTKSMSQQSPSPCNSFYLAGVCSVPKCKYSHLYSLTPPQVEEMRRGARFRLCNALKNGKECRDEDCFYGHHCPRGTTCARKNCAFNDEQHAGPPTVRAHLRKA